MEYAKTGRLKDCYCSNQNCNCESLIWRTKIYYL